MARSERHSTVRSVILLATTLVAGGCKKDPAPAPSGGAATQPGVRTESLRPVGMEPEHDRPDLAAPDPALAIERDRQRLPRVLQRIDLRQR